MTIEYVFNSQFLITQTALSMGSFLVKQAHHDSAC